MRIKLVSNLSPQAVKVRPICLSWPCLGTSWNGFGKALGTIIHPKRDFRSKKSLNSPLSHSSHLGLTLHTFVFDAIEDLQPCRTEITVACRKVKTIAQFPREESLRKQCVVKIRRDVGKSFKVSRWGYRCNFAHWYLQYLTISG